MLGILKPLKRFVWLISLIQDGETELNLLMAEKQ
jgi:hypothetical protein